MRPALTRLRRLRRARTLRRGMSIIEVMVAVTVMGVGVLGLASTASYVALQMGGGGVATVASTVGQQVYDSLAATPCASLTGGTVTKRRVKVTWTVADSTVRFKYVTESVEYPARKGSTRTVTYANLIPCL
jgi:prepilin-type N-terminal cleavage/methylation domain-containing protein